MYACIQNNTVREVIAMTAEDLACYYPAPFRESCVECPEETQPGWIYDGASFAPPPVHAPEPAVLLAGFTRNIQERLDVFARSEGRFYDNMLSLCTYAASANSVFRAEGAYGVAARDETWAKANEIMNAVLAGERAIPTWEELEAELPPLAWPE